MSSTFGSLKQLSYQSDYITNKKSKISYYCDNDIYGKKIKKNKTMPNYDQYNLFNNGRHLNNLANCYILPFNKTNLIAGLYSKMNLNGVCTVIDGNPCSSVCDSCDNPATIDAFSTVPFIQTNTIDPIGELFGNSQCGINNFTKYMEYKINN